MEGAEGLRVLVTGGSGLLGWWLAATLAERGYRVYATYHSRRPGAAELDGVGWVKLDLEDPMSIAEAVRAADPDVVVHAAAYTDVDGCEVDRSRALRVNYQGTLRLARAVAGRARVFIYISTDYVFDGRRGMYREDDEPNPINYYGLSKLLGEAATLSTLAEGGYVVRVSGLYGCSPTGKRNFGLTALERLQHGRPVRAFVDQYLSPTYVPHLAERLAALIDKAIGGKLEDRIIHLASDRLSRLEFALKLAKALGAPDSLVEPTTINMARLRAPRPRDSSLDISLAHRLGLAMPPQDTSIRHFAEACTQPSWSKR